MGPWLKAPPGGLKVETDTRDTATHRDFRARITPQRRRQSWVNPGRPIHSLGAPHSDPQFLPPLNSEPTSLWAPRMTRLTHRLGLRCRPPIDVTLPRQRASIYPMYRHITASYASPSLALCRLEVRQCSATRSTARSLWSLFGGAREGHLLFPPFQKPVKRAFSVPCRFLVGRGFGGPRVRFGGQISVWPDGRQRRRASLLTQDMRRRTESMRSSATSATVAQTVGAIVSLGAGPSL